MSSDNVPQSLSPISCARHIARRAVALIALCSLAACSKTAKWEEEVVLNTGVTITVQREIEYEYSGDAGNPLDIALRPRSRSGVLEFSWGGKSFRFAEHSAPTVLAIDTAGRPIILAPADSGAWDAINYYQCTIAFYAQFTPDGTGSHWTWPKEIDKAYLDLATNLLQRVPLPDSKQRTFTAPEVQAINLATFKRDPYRLRIDPTFSGDRCKPKEEN